MESEHRLYGLVAEFKRADDLVKAAQSAHDAGYRQLDAYAPFPVHGLAEAVGFHGTRVPLLVLIGGMVGMFAGFGLQYYTSVIDYPLNVGGRPYNSWPSFVPVTFEVTILFAAFCAVVGMIVLNGLPRPYHPIFNAPGFERASQDRFFLCIEATDPKFDRVATERFLLEHAPLRVEEVVE